MDVDTRVLRYFVAVAEELSFTLAAERLYVSQPALSRQIRQMEADLRISLFERTSREVRLTLAGEALLPSARRLVADWQAAQRTARSVAAAELRVLRVGFEATSAGPLSAKARQLFAERHPDVTIEPMRFDWGGEAAALRDGVVDIAFLWLPADTAGLHAEIVAVEPRMVGFATGHRLAGQETVTIGDLADEPLMSDQKSAAPLDRLVGGQPAAGRLGTQVGSENDNVEEMLENVAGGAAVCIGPRSMATHHARPRSRLAPDRRRRTAADRLRLARHQQQPAGGRFREGGPPAVGRAERS